MRKADLAWAAARILLGAFFVAAPTYVLIKLGGDHPPELVPAAGDFTGALNRSGFMNPLLTADLLAGGAALLFNRSAPIGILLLAPAVAVIAGFHWFLTHSYIWGSIWPAWLGLLAWHYRAIFARLWEQPTG